MKICHIPRNSVTVHYVQAFNGAIPMPDDYAGSMTEWYHIDMTSDESEALDLPEHEARSWADEFAMQVQS